MMALSDLTVRQAKAAEKIYSLPDTDSLGLVAACRRQIVALALLLARQAKYPEIGLGEARTLRDEARALLAKASTLTPTASRSGTRLSWRPITPLGRLRCLG